ncbi:MAG: glycosyltransferase [Chitinophagales bacterium]|mgnify:CR=1 FL=1|nr:glycosyltransferase [Chitinophagales bacterium]
MNILHVCTPTSIHDHKWILFFSNRSDIKQFVIWETIFETPENQSAKKFFLENGITVLPAYSSFSLKNIFSTFNSVKKLNGLIDNHKIDIVHMLFTTPHALYAPFLTTPFILTTRGSDILKVIPGLRTTKGIKGWHNKILFSIFRRAFQKAAFVTSTSQKQIDCIADTFHLSRNCRLIRTGVDVETIAQLDASEYIPQPLAGVKFIFSPRWMFPQYNLETQIAAIRLLNKTLLEEYTFVFIHGKDVFMEPDDYFLKMKDEIENVAGLKYLIFDRLTPKEVWTCFKKASLTIMVPHTDGTPNSALEAMSARCKLIMGDADYDSILFDDTCIRINKTDARQLASAIESALQSYPDELLERAFSRVNLHGNRAIEMNKLLELYRCILQSN